MHSRLGQPLPDLIPNVRRQIDLAQSLSHALQPGPGPALINLEGQVPRSKHWMSVRLAIKRRSAKELCKKHVLFLHDWSDILRKEILQVGVRLNLRVESLYERTDRLSPTNYLKNCVCFHGAYFTTQSLPVPV